MDSLKIGPIVYEIKRVAGLHSNNSEDKRVFLLGQIDYSAAVIELKDGMADKITPYVLMHEAIHGILYSAGHPDHDESIVIALEYGIVGLLRDNPEFMKLICPELFSDGSHNGGSGE